MFNRTDFSLRHPDLPTRMRRPHLFKFLLLFFELFLLFSYPFLLSYFFKSLLLVQ